MVVVVAGVAVDVRVVTLVLLVEVEEMLDGLKRPGSVGRANGAVC